MHISEPTTLDSQIPPRRKAPVRDDVAYVAPMFVFLAFVWAGGHWPAMYPYAYVARAIIVAVLLVIFWPAYTKIRWNFWWLGIIGGVVGIFQWVEMQLWLQSHFELFRPSPEVFNPTKAFESPALMWTWIVLRIASAVLVVPVMEELFWRDFGWRTILAPNDFKLAQVGEWDWKAYLIISGAFALVHGNWWLTAIVWGLMIGALLVYTKSLGACILMHATTNLLLAGYVLYTRDWSFW